MCRPSSAASVLQPQHGRDVRQHPQQAAAAQAQHLQRGPTPAGGPAAEGADQEAGLQGRLCECLVSDVLVRRRTNNKHHV